MKKHIIVLWIFVSLFISCATYNIEFDADTIKVAAIGDSITYGLTVSNRKKNSYPAQLDNMLGSGWAVLNFGVSGTTLLKDGNLPYWNTIQLSTAYDFQPDLVIIKLGTNDSKTKNWMFKKQFVDDYVQLINSFKQMQNNPTVIICYPVPAYSGVWGIRDHIIKEEIIPLIDIVADLTGTKIIDLYNALSNRIEMFPDTVHPDKDGALLIAETIYSFIEKELVF